MLAVANIKQLGQVNSGYGHIGENDRFLTDSDRLNFVDQLSSYTHSITKYNTAACGDGRPTLNYADGTTNYHHISQRIDYQLFGGLGLASTKAAVAANLEIISNARNFSEAYFMISNFLAINGEEDGGHYGCWASATVESSVSNRIADNEQKSFLSRLITFDYETESMLNEINKNKIQKLDSGYYSIWDLQEHEQYLKNRFPQNFATLDDSPSSKLHNHHEAALYLITEERQGFDKNNFTKDNNGLQSFAVTINKYQQIGTLLAKDIEERKRFLLAAYDDTLQVGSGLVIRGLPVFIQN